jgi:hypothetical protein
MAEPSSDLTADLVLPLVSFEVPPELSAFSRGEHENERSDSCIPAAGDIEIRIGHERHKIVESHASVFVKVSKRAAMAGSFHAEIDDEHPPAGLQHPPNLPDTRLARGASKVVKHHRAQNDVELRVRVRQRFGMGGLEGNVECRSGCFVSSPRNHLWRSVDPPNRTSRTDSAFGRNCERSGPAPDVQHGVTQADFGKVEHFLADRTLSSQGQ